MTFVYDWAVVMGDDVFLGFYPIEPYLRKSVWHVTSYNKINCYIPHLQRNPLVDDYTDLEVSIVLIVIA
jgi:hypothetical protein